MGVLSFWMVCGLSLKPFIDSRGVPGGSKAGSEAGKESHHCSSTNVSVLQSSDSGLTS